MAWSAPMIHALLLRTPTVPSASPLRVAMTNRPTRISPAQTRHETASGYGRP